jgi:hypothetical protein
MDQQMASQLRADLFLPHAPSVYDFRERDHMLSAYLSDGVNVTSVYEMYPIGFRLPEDHGCPQDPDPGGQQPHHRRETATAR